MNEEERKLNELVTRIDREADINALTDIALSLVAEVAADLAAENAELRAKLAQVEVVPEWKESIKSYVCACHSEDPDRGWLVRFYTYCFDCGRRLKWDEVTP